VLAGKVVSPTCKNRRSPKLCVRVPQRTRRPAPPIRRQVQARARLRAKALLPVDALGAHWLSLFSFLHTGKMLYESADGPCAGISAAYSPTSPAYSPTSPAYSPTSPAYSPTSPGTPPRPCRARAGMLLACARSVPALSLCVRARPCATPAGDHTLTGILRTLAAYSPTSPSYSPTSPAYSPTSPGRRPALARCQADALESG